MAALSDTLLVVAILVYLAAMLAYAAEFAFATRGVVARAAAHPRPLVGAGGPPVAQVEELPPATEADPPDAVLTSPPPTAASRPLAVFSKPPSTASAPLLQVPDRGEPLPARFSQPPVMLENASDARLKWPPLTDA